MNESTETETEIEIGWDPVSHAMEHDLRIDEDHEILPDGEWIRWARRFTREPRLFLYRHRFHGTFVLCCWIFPPGKLSHPVAQELCTMPEHPDSSTVDRPGANQLWHLTRIDPDLTAKLARMERERQAEKRSRLVDRVGRRRERAAHFAARGKTDLAAAVMNQKVDALPEADVSDQMGYLRGVLKNRVTTWGRDVTNEKVSLGGQATQN